MSNLSDYLSRADETKKKILTEQWKEGCDHGTIHCPCGQLRSLMNSYRCLYCGIWFCINCAQVHFGMTLQEWIEKKRVEKRECLRQQKGTNNTVDGVS